MVCGPTGIGKTGLTLRLAKEFKGELVSADARQVYQYMDVVTGKDIPAGSIKQKAKIKYNRLQIGCYRLGEVGIWGYDLVKPDEEFNVHLYLEFACRILTDIWKRGKLPMMVGGTGMYLRSVVNPPLTLGIPINQRLRHKLEGKSANGLLKLLDKKDPAKAAMMTESDKMNSRRLIRALEVADYKARSNNRKEKIEGEGLSTELRDFVQEIEGLDVLWVGLMKKKRLLYERIDKRVEERLSDERIVDELEYLLDQDYLPRAPAVTMGYEQLMTWMGGEVELEEAVQKWKFAEHGYARRQLTWFRKQQEINWFDVLNKGWESEVVKLVRGWYTGRRFKIQK